MKPAGLKLGLTDQNGMHYDLGHLAGRRSLVYFGFLHCKAVCPRSLAKLAEIMKHLGEKCNEYRVIYISVDPERDTPEAMKAFLDAHYPGFIGLTGDSSAIETTKESMKVFSRRTADPDDPAGYAVPHTALIYLVDEAGRYLTHFADHLDAKEIAQRLTEQDRN